MKLEFDRTAQTLLHLSKQMSDVHEMYPGKENQKKREALLKPYRDCCVVLHYERIRLNRETKAHQSLHEVCSSIC